MAKYSFESVAYCVLSDMDGGLDEGLCAIFASKSGKRVAVPSADNSINLLKLPPRERIKEIRENDLGWRLHSDLSCGRIEISSDQGHAASRSITEAAKSVSGQCLFDQRSIPLLNTQIPLLGR